MFQLHRKLTLSSADQNMENIYNIFKIYPFILKAIFMFLTVEHISQYRIHQSYEFPAYRAPAVTSEKTCTRNYLLPIENPHLSIYD